MQGASLTMNDAGGGQKDGISSGCKTNRRLPRQVLLECQMGIICQAGWEWGQGGSTRPGKKAIRAKANQL